MYKKKYIITFIIILILLLIILALYFYKNKIFENFANNTTIPKTTLSSSKSNLSSLKTPQTTIKTTPIATNKYNSIYLFDALTKSDNFTNGEINTLMDAKNIISKYLSSVLPKEYLTMSLDQMPANYKQMQLLNLIQNI